MTKPICLERTGACLDHPTIQRLVRLNISDCWQFTANSLISMVTKPMDSLQELVVNSGLSDQAMSALATACPNLKHLNISYDILPGTAQSGQFAMSEVGFKSIGRFKRLQVLNLMRVGVLTDAILPQMLSTLNELTHLKLNVHGCHNLTDSGLANLSASCPRLRHFESLHANFVARRSVLELAKISSLRTFIVRGNIRICDNELICLLKQCRSLETFNVDGCLGVGKATFRACIQHAKSMSPTIFRASLINTFAFRTNIEENLGDMLDNLRIQCSNQNIDTVHFDEWNGEEILECLLKTHFFPAYYYGF